jgi:general secretion pathway protein L
MRVKPLIMERRRSAGLADFLHWWAGELKGLLPRQAARGPATRRLVIALDGPGKTLLMEKGGRATVLGMAAGASDSLAVLAGLVRAQPGMPIGLRLGPEQCFIRKMQLPAQAESDFAGILDLDMERTTPFRATDVLTAFYVEPSADVPRGKRAVRHLIVKRKGIEPLLEEMRDHGLEPAFVDCWDAQRRGGLPVDFLATSRPNGGGERGFSLHGVAGLCLLLVALAAAIPVMRHREVLASLQARTASARAEAATVRQALEASQGAAARLEAVERRLRGRLPVARILEELTAILPDSAWVSDLRIEGGAVEFTGFAKSAASLIPLLEASPLFAEAALTSPVVLDNNEDKERFSARLRLDMPDRVAEAQNAEAQDMEPQDETAPDEAPR